MEWSDPAYRVPTRVLLDRLDFIASNPWTDGEVLNYGMIISACICKSPEDGAEPYDGREDWSFEAHMDRIAYIAEHYEEFTQPVYMDVYPNGDWMLIDGNHRLAATWYLGVPSVDVSFFGFIDEIPFGEIEAELAN